MKVTLTIDATPERDQVVEQIDGFADQFGGHRDLTVTDGLVYVFDSGNPDQDSSRARQLGGLLNQARIVTGITYQE